MWNTAGVRGAFGYVLVMRDSISVTDISGNTGSHLRIGHAAWGADTSATPAAHGALPPGHVAVHGYCSDGESYDLAQPSRPSAQHATSRRRPYRALGVPSRAAPLIFTYEGRVMEKSYGAVASPFSARPY